MRTKSQKIGAGIGIAICLTIAGACAFDPMWGTVVIATICGIGVGALAIGYFPTK